nr:protein kinase [Deltaproteobacteria bacterium]
MGPHRLDQDDRQEVGSRTRRDLDDGGSAPRGLANTDHASEDDEPLSDLREGRVQQQLEDKVLQRLFDVEPRTETIGRYRVLEQIGRGGMGTVLAAYDDQLDRKVAIKVLDSKGRRVRAASRRLQREAQALARLSHPNVVMVHEVGEADGEVYVVMEFLRGQSLDAWIDSHPEWPQVLEVFTQAGLGLVAAHAAGIVHRDLKPHNIMRTDDGMVKVLDFGLARAENTDLSDASEEAHDTPDDSVFDARLTRSGARLGTPAYMAPEQHRGETADVRTDQYGFCAALYQALYWRLPFEAPTLPAMVMKILHEDLPPPPAGTRVPSWLARVVQRGLAADPAERWPSMQALLQALARDPAKVRRRRATIAGLGLFAALGGYAVSQVQTAAAKACPGAQDEVDLLWSGERRRAIEVAFGAASSRLAADTLARTAEPIGAYVEGLGSMRAQACEAHRAGRESDRLFSLRTACLDVRRAGFEQLMQQFERADAAAVDNAAWAVASLPWVDRCGDAEALSASIPPPDDPEAAALVQAQREALASARSMSLAGAYDEARRRARSALERALVLDHPPLVAEAELRLGDILRESSQDALAYDVLSRAVRSALTSVHYEAAVEALALRMWIEADRLGRPREALASNEIADAMLETLGRPPRLEWLLLNNRAVAQFRAGALSDAERSYGAALEAAQAPGEGALPVEVISTQANLGILQSEGQGRPDAAARELRSARARALELLGSEHPRVYLLNSMLAEFLVAAGRPTEALSEFGPALQRPAPDAYSRVKLLIDATQANHDLRRHAAALRHAEEALELAREALPDDFFVSVALWRRGSARVGLGETEPGLQDLRDAVAREVERVGPQGDTVALARIWAGLGLRRAGRLDEAIGQLEHALEITVARGPAGQSALGRRFFELVDAYLERGSPSSAEALILRIADAQDAAGFAVDSHYRLVLDMRLGALSAARGDTAAARAAYARACPGLSVQVESV